ncbi:hypothetical protein ASPFODRAFT_49504, partial [Aspergillus luchuensis CBS 106.47]
MSDEEVAAEKMISGGIFNNFTYLLVGGALSVRRWWRELKEEKKEKKQKNYIYF